MKSFGEKVPGSLRTDHPSLKWEEHHHQNVEHKDHVPTGKTTQIAAEMKNYNLELLGISEARWTQSGQKRLMSGKMLLYSGHEEDVAPHIEGVSLTL